MSPLQSRCDCGAGRVDSTQDPRETDHDDRCAVCDLPGDVVRPQDRDCDTVRAVFDGMIDRRPLAVVRCRDTADVARGVTFASEHRLPVSIRGGGHSVDGQQVDDRELRHAVATADARVLVDGTPIDRSSCENGTTAPVQCGMALSIGLSINSSLPGYYG